MSRMYKYFGFLFIISYNVSTYQAIYDKQKSFEVKYEWNYINFTWPSIEKYEAAYNSQNYVPENNDIAGIKFYGENLYVAIPRFKPGVPVTLARMSTITYPANKLFTPYPSWEMNEQGCSSLENVISMEINPDGIMWVLDGTRINSFTKCPPKLVLLDLNNDGKVVSSYIFNEKICLRAGGFLNDIVLDESDGGYAYITDNGNIDPGLIVYSKSNNSAWKFRDSSMFPDLSASKFIVNGTIIPFLSPINGIALSPIPQHPSQPRTIYYCSLTGYNLYSISTDIVKNRDSLLDGKWREYVKFVGRKKSQSGGLILDNQGFLYFGLINEHSIGKWNINKSFKSARTIYHNSAGLLWPDSFAIDSEKNLNCLDSAVYKFQFQNYHINLSKLNIKIFSVYTGNNNYMFKH